MCNLTTAKYKKIIIIEGLKLDKTCKNYFNVALGASGAIVYRRAVQTGLVEESKIAFYGQFRFPYVLR